MAEPETEKKGAGMMRMHVVVVCSVVGFLGLVILILGVVSEAATAQALDLYGEIDINGGGLNIKCVYRTTPALGCGIVAAVLALTAQVYVTSASLCSGCCQTWELPKETRSIAGIALSVVSWIIVIIVVALFITGAVMNTDQKRDLSSDGKCLVDPGNVLFAAATVFSVVATVLQISSCVLLLVTPKGSTKPLGTEQQELATGQPEPQQDEDERHARLVYQPPVSSTFLSEQTSHQQPVSSTFISEQTNTSHQPPTRRTCSDGDPPLPSAPSLSDRGGANKLCRRGQPTPMDFYKISESHC